MSESAPMSDTPKQPEAADRLAKVIARAGLCSRRDAEGWIADGRVSVNGKKVQNGNTKTMIFTAAQIVSYLSQIMTLLPGDVITTGTPPGVGLGQKPEPWYLKAGDVVELGIEKLGEQRQDFVAWAPAK